MKFTVVGAGLAGVEAAWQIANAGYKVRLIEMKPVKFSPAHKSEYFAELVCSNSLKASRIESAAGLLKEEMFRLGSLTVATARKYAVPAGGALAVDRVLFSQAITESIKNHPNIEIENRVYDKIKKEDDEILIIATGPLTEGALFDEIKKLCGDYLSFYDAAAPIVTAESIDMSKAFSASRYDRGGEDDYINCPFNKEEYESFIEELINAEGAVVHDFDVYEGCMPIEKLAKRGKDLLMGGTAAFSYINTALIGSQSLWTGSLTAFTVVAAAQAVSLKLSTDWKRAAEYFAPALMLLMLYYVMFFSFTVFPPRLGLFRDPLTGGFGVRGGL